MQGRQFLHEALPARVLFGAGSVSKLPEEVARLQITRALVVSTPEQSDQGYALCKLLGGASVGQFSGARMHTPTDVTDDACAKVRELGADGLVAIGGGSTIGLAKAIALRTDLPQVVVPTTYAGSEVTPIIGQTEKGVKITKRSLRVLPEIVIYDPELTASLSISSTVTSGINAIAHAAEALYAPQVSPILKLLAEEGTQAIFRALPRLFDNPSDIEARTDALYGAWLCGTCLGLVGMGLHHKLCHVLGGSFDLPHAETHSIILPHVLAYNLEHAPEARNILARAVEDADPASALYRLLVKTGSPTSLHDLGLPETGLAEVLRLSMENSYPNPRPLSETGIARLLRDAWAGNPPPLASRL